MLNRVIVIDDAHFQQVAVIRDGTYHPLEGWILTQGRHQPSQRGGLLVLLGLREVRVDRRQYVRLDAFVEVVHTAGGFALDLFLLDSLVLVGLFEQRFQLFQPCLDPGSGVLGQSSALLPLQLHPSRCRIRRQDVHMKMALVLFHPARVIRVSENVVTIEVIRLLARTLSSPVSIEVVKFWQEVWIVV